MARIAVVGAGPAGCTAACELVRRGHEVVLFERDTVAGGRTQSVRRDGWVLDTGAGFFTNFYPHLAAQIESLGLSDQVVTLSRSSTLVREGRASALSIGSVGSFLRFDHLSAGAKLRMAMRTAAVTLRYRSLDLSEPASLAPHDTMSIADEARRKVGEEAYQYLVRPGVEPFWYFSCEEVSRALLLALQARSADARFFTLRDGMDSLCRAMITKVETRLGSEVTSITADGPSLIVKTAAGEQRFDRVLVASTASVAAKLVKGLPATDVSDDMRAFLESQRYVANTHVAYRVAAKDCPDASAAFPCGPGEHPVAAINFNSKKCQGDGSRDTAYELASVFLSTQQSLAFQHLPEAELVARTFELGREMWPAMPERYESFHVVRRNEAIPVHGVGRYRDAARLLAAPVGRVAFAGDYLATATVDGAIRSGQRAAEALSR